MTVLRENLILNSFFFMFLQKATTEKWRKLIWLTSKRIINAYLLFLFCQKMENNNESNLAAAAAGAAWPQWPQWSKLHWRSYIQAPFELDVTFRLFRKYFLLNSHSKHKIQMQSSTYEKWTKFTWHKYTFSSDTHIE